MVSRQSGVAQGVRNGNGGNDTVRANCQGNRYDGAHMHHRETGSFNLFYHRCAATSASASRRGENNGINVILMEIFGDFRAEFFGIGNSGTITNGSIPVGVNGTEFAVGFHFTQYVDG